MGNKIQSYEQAIEWQKNWKAPECKEKDCYVCNLPKSKENKLK